ncbi:hypothetical protein PG994_004216 [Apiospora phragmitis]|uniref:Uncharacterized protein n=1 Tax=Apiospora phragmitis TaxID=2905665 RepID=A0ABR1VQ82_9PEZI
MAPDNNVYSKTGYESLLLSCQRRKWMTWPVPKQFLCTCARHRFCKPLYQTKRGAGGGKGRDDSYERRLAAVEGTAQQLGSMVGQILQALKDASEKQEETSMANAKTLKELLDAALKGGEDEDSGVR